ncbi:MAG: hypothetical protein PHS86_07515 [Syntrophaceae bacterium]|nr:hypothetical protein [Syntrophaceae bacterium]
MTVENDCSSLEIRCPRLGSPVKFSYCIIESTGQPCIKSVSCWTPYFDISRLLTEKMGRDNFEIYFSKEPKPKIVTLIELIEKAREAAGRSKSDG